PPPAKRGKLEPRDRRQPALRNHHPPPPGPRASCCLKALTLRAPSGLTDETRRPRCSASGGARAKRAARAGRGERGGDRLERGDELAELARGQALVRWRGEL